MKVLAKELKVGDVISVPVKGTSTITGIEERYQKNGKMYFFISLTYNPTSLKGKKNLDVLYEGAEKFKPETKVTIK